MKPSEISPLPHRRSNSQVQHRAALLRTPTALSLLVLWLLAAACGPGPAPAPSATPDTAPAPEPAAFDLRSNLAPESAVTASGSNPSNPPELAVDGAIGYVNSWVASGGDVQWIELTFGSLVTIERIELLVSQPRTAETVHQIWVGRAGREELLHEFRGQTSNHQILEFSPPEPWLEVQYLRIETHETPSLAAWQEIQVFGVPSQAPVESAGASHIFHNAQVLTMEAALPLAQAIAIQDDTILAVGDNAEVLALRGPDTLVVDLGGLALAPGFVDAHTHVLNDPESIGEDLNSVQDLALRHGVTTLANLYSPAGVVEALQAMERAGELRMRVSLYLPFNNGCGEHLEQDWYLQYPRQVDPDRRLHITGIKVFSDGGSCNAPAVSFEYPSGVGMGDLYYSQGEMDGIVAGIQAQGYQAAVHALGDRAVEQVLTALERAMGGQAATYRHRIEHNAVVRPDLYPRYSQVRPVAILFGAFPTCIHLGEPSRFRYALPESHRTLEWPWRELIEANPEVVFAWHGDTPVFEFNPIRNLFGFATRADIAADGSICEPPDWIAANAIPVETALRMMTINAAYALFRDNTIGSLRAGKQADLIVLSQNPLSMDPGSLLELEVLLTLFDGQTAYCAPGYEALCP